MSAVRFEGREIILEVQHIQPFRSPDKSFNSIDPNFPVLDFKEVNIFFYYVFNTIFSYKLNNYLSCRFSLIKTYVKQSNLVPLLSWLFLLLP